MQIEEIFFMQWVNFAAEYFFSFVGSNFEALLIAFKYLISHRANFIALML